MKIGHIKKRNLIMQVVLAIVTLGIYFIDWFYSTLKEIHIANGSDEGAGMWTVLMMVPIIGYFASWHYASEFAVFNRDKYPALLIFLAWIVFAPIVWILVQTELNKAAEGGAVQPAAA